MTNGRILSWTSGNVRLPFEPDPMDELVSAIIRADVRRSSASAPDEPGHSSLTRGSMRHARPFVVVAGAVLLLSGLGYSVSRYNLLHVYYGEPDWWRVVTGTVLLLTGLYVTKFAKVT